MVHPGFAYLMLQSKRGHALSFLVLKKTMKERQACPRVFFIMDLGLLDIITFGLDMSKEKSFSR
jgi:hypothetical protein